MTASLLLPVTSPFEGITVACIHSSSIFCVLAGRGPEEDGGRERPHPESLQPLLRPHYRQRQPGQGLRDVTGCRGQTVQ